VQLAFNSKNKQFADRAYWTSNKVQLAFNSGHKQFANTVYWTSNKVQLAFNSGHKQLPTPQSNLKQLSILLHLRVLGKWVWKPTV
jgi:hypothetical protein